MASNPPAQCCTVGVKHDGQPTGETLTISTYTAYLATPPPAIAVPQKAILYIPDVVGIWQNSQLMADQFAVNGYLTLIVDIFNGDAVPLNRPANFDLMGWVQKGSTGDNPHTKEAVDPIVEAGLKWLREERGVERVGGAGYCFGAKYVARHYPDIQVGYFGHPSFVDEAELRGFKGPLSISAAETDTIFTTEMRHRSEVILAEEGHPYQINLFSQVEHGFSVRGDVSKKNVKFAKEQAFCQAVTWFHTWL